MDRVSQGTVVTIGNFDGVHRGHQQLIECGRRHAQQLGMDLVAVTFDPHPRTVLKSEPTRSFIITSTAEKQVLLKRLGVSRVDVLAFTKEFSEMTARAFLDEEIGQRLKSRMVVVGHNFTFGRGGQGTPELLHHWGQEHGVEVEVLDPVYDRGGRQISSSRVRAAIAAGELDEAAQLMGRPFQVYASIVSGAGRGRSMGIPTANMAIGIDHIMPPMGIYAGYCVLPSGETAPAVASWGLRPTFADLDQPLLEVHVIDRTDDLTGLPLWFGFVQKIREERYFDRVEDLVRRMQDDVAIARAGYDPARWKY